MTYFKCGAAILLAACTASCASLNSNDMITVDQHYGGIAPTMDPNRKVSEQDCSQSSASDDGNLRCK